MNNNALDKILSQLDPNEIHAKCLVALAFTAGAKAHRNATQIKPASKINHWDLYVVGTKKAREQQKEKSRLFFLKLKEENIK